MGKVTEKEGLDTRDLVKRLARKLDMAESDARFLFNQVIAVICDALIKDVAVSRPLTILRLGRFSVKKGTGGTHTFRHDKSKKMVTVRHGAPRISFRTSAYVKDRVRSRLEEEDGQ